MSLAGYQPETREIKIKGDKLFHVRGLSLIDLSVLIREHYPDLDAVFDLFQNFQSLTAENFKPLAMSLVSQAPGLAANVIALAEGEASATDAQRLPVHIQLNALLAIGELTFSEVGGVKKSMEMIATLLTNLKGKDPKKAAKPPIKSRQ